ncbi:MAG: DUF58 domain-containing protein [Lachnospiraceae bacterium]|nr:DUF58 domain-containing protein [Lachnospiraceae bacterium]
MRWRRTIFLMMWILSLVGISLYGGPISYGLFWGLTLLPVISALYLLYVFLNFKIYQEIGSRSIVCKQPMPYYFTLKNESLCTFAGLRVKMFEGFSQVLDVAENQEYQLLPEEKYVYQTQLNCFYRGEYEVGVKEIILTDFLRLFQIRYKNPGTIKALVYPRLLHLQSIKGVEKELNNLSMEYPWDQSRLDVLTKEYTPGDSLKQIHFKASAREGKLKSRTRWGERQQQIRLFFDTQRIGSKLEEFLPLENQILETVLAIGEYMAYLNVSYSAHFLQQQEKEMRVEGLRQFDGFYETVSHIEFGETQRLGDLLKGANAARDCSGQIWIVIGSRLEEETLKQLQMVAASDGRVLVYLISDGGNEDFLKWENERLKIYHIPVEGKLEELL